MADRGGFGLSIDAFFTYIAKQYRYKRSAVFIDRFFTKKFYE